MKVLLKNKADANVKSLKSQSSALKYAYQNHNLDFIELLLAHGAKFSTNEFPPQIIKDIQRFVKEKFEETKTSYPEKFLLKSAKNNPNVIMREPNGIHRMPALHYLLKKFYQVCYKPESAQEFHDVIHNSEALLLNTMQTKLLQSIHQQIDQGFNITTVSSDDLTPIAIAIENADPNMVQIILSHHKANAMIRSANKLSTIAGLMAIRPSAQQPMQHVLEKLKELSSEEKYFSPSSRYGTELSYKKDRLFSVAELLVAYNPYLCTKKINFGNTYLEPMLLSPLEFAQKHGLHKLTEIIQKHNPISLFEQTAKQLITNMLETGFGYQKKNLDTLPKEIIERLVDELDKLLLLEQKQEKLLELKSCIIAEYLSQQ